jgi:hypothetical protein
MTILKKREDITFDRLIILFIWQVIFQWLFPIVSSFLLIIFLYYPEFYIEVISYTLWYIRYISGQIFKESLPVCHLNAGGGPMNAGVGQLTQAQLRIQLTSMLPVIRDNLNLDMNNRHRGNIVDLFTATQIRAFMQETEGIRDIRTNNRMFVAMRDLNANELQASNTQGINNPNAIFIYHRGNYRPMHAYNTHYLNTVLNAIDGG